MENPPVKNQRLMIAFMKQVTLPRILKDLQEKEREIITECPSTHHPKNVVKNG